MRFQIKHSHPGHHWAALKSEISQEDRSWGPQDTLGIQGQPWSELGKAYPNLPAASGIFVFSFVVVSRVNENTLWMPAELALGWTDFEYCTLTIFPLPCLPSEIAPSLDTVLVPREPGFLLDIAFLSLVQKSTHLS